MTPYQRVQFGDGSSGMPKMVKNLIIANVAIYIIQALVGNRMVLFFGLVPKLVWTHFFVWQWFTYMFLHGGLMHLGFNMYVLWMLGSDIERMWGSRAFLQYYLISGVGAGVFYSLVKMQSMIPTIGASGAVYAILVAFAVLFPDRRLMMIFPPIIMKARTLVLILLGIELFQGITGSMDGIAHVAHLGGALVGYLYMRRGMQLPVTSMKSGFLQWNERRKQKAKWTYYAELTRLRKVVDDILDKANDVGMENLSREEKNQLERASRILNKEKDNKQGT